MLSQSQIDSKVSMLKSWYSNHYPVCGYCGHVVRKDGELSHIIRRSYSRALQTEKLNTCLAHNTCHQIWDDSPEQAVYLPRALEILYVVFLLSPDYFNIIAPHFDQFSDAIAQFPEVPYRDIQYHGEILQLNYLYQNKKSPHSRQGDLT